MERNRRNTRVSYLMDGILASKVGRLQKFGQICMLGYDAKDFLLEQCHTDETAEDVLARRFYGNTALGSIHRSIAVQEWLPYQRAPYTLRGLDRALAAFEMFFLRERDGDVDDIDALLDRLASDFLSEQPHFSEKSTRQKALLLAQWVRAKNLTGMEDEEVNYRNLRNCLIGHALLEDQHESLPIISSAIYCCLAERVGLRAACCAFPSHVHAMVMAPPGEQLDGGRVPNPTTDVEKMFLDPYRSSEEVTLQDLRSKLVELGWMSSGDSFLVASPTAVIVQRTAQNMKTTYSKLARMSNIEPEARYQLRRLRNGDHEMNAESALYAALWANLLVNPVSSFQWDHSLDVFLSRFHQLFSEDLWLVEKYLLPLYNVFTESQAQTHHRFSWQNVHEMVNMVRNMDQRQPTVNRRYTQEIQANVWYKVGQVFRHKRYDYIGIINGWGDKGTGSLPTPHSLSMDETMEEYQDTSDSDSSARSRFRKKTYYTCLRTDIDRHVIAQDNIEIITDPSLIPERLFFVAGKFFKRFDSETCRFVSNIREFFPDD